MAPIRLRHPKGVTTLQIDVDNASVLDLQQQIYAATDIPPSQQDLKSGYPPQSLTLIPELPLASLGLKGGDQLTLIQQAGASSAPFTASPPRPSAPSSAAPRSSAPQAALPSVGATHAQGPYSVPTEGGYLVHRIVPDDNSCLFSSIALIFEQDMGKAPMIRQIVADAIRKDPETWSDAILGRPREEYISTILKPSTWGGAIELTILASHYSTEIASVDVETGRVDHFTPPPARDSGNRCILVYSGIHYDAATLAPMLEAPAEFHQTVVPITMEGDSDAVVVAAKKLADILRSKRAYTNMATFTLRCQVCKKGLKGEKEARSHATETGHVEFGEY
ncbi:OTU-domain-containing protein [Daedalea quercina L-15889]|uniref:Ubiquitin thioesterase OTU n=1 Tax=Daedalea quercina L-15889 TaxID=1314783 RepID=A0A165PFJ0_9APHY|nr:OTU-domain-containing protein [Daedalea quercina L-15889]